MAHTAEMSESFPFTVGATRKQTTDYQATDASQSLSCGTDVTAI